MDIVTLIGFMAATVTTAGFIPQAVKALKTRQTKDISLWMYIILFVGVSLWFIYGICLVNWPIILSNGITLILLVPILVLKICYSPDLTDLNNNEKDR